MTVKINLASPKIELNEIVALAYNAGIGLNTARVRLLKHCNVERMSVEELFSTANVRNTNNAKVYNYKGKSGTTIELAYWNDTTVPKITEILRSEGIIPPKVSTVVPIEIPIDGDDLGPRKDCKDIPGGGSWEKKHLHPKGEFATSDGMTPCRVHL